MKILKHLLLWYCLLLFNTIQGQTLLDSAKVFFERGEYTLAKNWYTKHLKMDSSHHENSLIQKIEKCIEYLSEAEKHCSDGNSEAGKNKYGCIRKINPKDPNIECLIKECADNIAANGSTTEKSEAATEKELASNTTISDNSTKTNIAQEGRVNIGTIIGDVTINQPPEAEPSKPPVIPPPIETFKFLPFGIHQCKNKAISKSLLFSTVEIGLLGASAGFYISAQKNLQKHKDLGYDEWERDRFHDKYKNQQKLSCYMLAGAGVAILLNYLDNFNWCRKNNTKLTLMPLFDEKYNPQMAMVVTIKF